MCVNELVSVQVLYLIAGSSWPQTFVWLRTYTHSHTVYEVAMWKLLEQKVSRGEREGFETIKPMLTTHRQSFHNSYLQEVGWNLCLMMAMPHGKQPLKGYTMKHRHRTDTRLAQDTGVPHLALARSLNPDRCGLITPVGSTGNSFINGFFIAMTVQCLCTWGDSTHYYNQQMEFSMCGGNSGHICCHCGQSTEHT